MSDPMEQVWDAMPVGMPKLEAHNEARGKARIVLVEALTRDFVQSMYDDGAFLYDVARVGHVGFNRRPDNELVQDAIDRGLDEQRPDVTEAITTLET